MITSKVLPLNLSACANAGRLEPASSMTAVSAPTTLLFIVFLPVRRCCRVLFLAQLLSLRRFAAFVGVATHHLKPKEMNWEEGAWRVNASQPGQAGGGGGGGGGG